MGVPQLGGVITRGGGVNGGNDCEGGLIDLGQTAGGVITRGRESKGVGDKGGDTGNKGWANMSDSLVRKMCVVPFPRNTAGHGKAHA